MKKRCSTPRLFTYRIAHDNGSAPNPFWGTCSLVICKPAIRRAAQVGDWVVGVGSSVSPVGDISKCVIYAMEVTEKMTMEEYDTFCAKQLPRKIPNWKIKDAKRRMGDSIYDYSANPPKVRRAVHNESHRAHDLSGKYALLSRHFIYFGEHAVKLPNKLLPIADIQRGHRSNANAPYVQPFIQWISKTMDGKSRILAGNPSSKLFKRFTVLYGES